MIGLTDRQRETLTVIDDPSAGGSDPGSYARALEHSVHIQVSSHPNRAGPLLTGAARAAAPSSYGGTGTPFDPITSEHDREVSQL